MTPKMILQHLDAGRAVALTVRRLRGYLHGDATITFQPGDAWHGGGVTTIKHALKCFRFDEKPYDNPRWVVGETR